MTAVRSDTSDTGPYGLVHPTYADALESLQRVHLGNVDGLWRQLLDAAGLAEPAPDAPICDDLLRVMLQSDPVTQLTAHALQILQRSYLHLSAAAEIIRSAS